MECENQFPYRKETSNKDMLEKMKEEKVTFSTLGLGMLPSMPYKMGAERPIVLGTPCRIGRCYQASGLSKCVFSGPD